MVGLGLNGQAISLGGMGLPNGAYQPSSSVLIKILASRGYVTSLDSTGHFFLAFDHQEESYGRFIDQGGSVSRSILIRQETDAVYPGQYKKRVEDKYGLIITLGGTREIEGSHSFKHPYMQSANPAYPTSEDIDFVDAFEDRKKTNVYDLSSWKRRPIYFSFIGANKVGLDPKGNYVLRRRLVTSLAPVGLEVYGILWNDGLKRRLINRVSMALWGLRTHQLPPLWSMFSDLFQRYENAKGEVLDKNSILLRSKFSLIVENTNRMITEKLFDSLLSGTIPVYYGPDLGEFDLPATIALEIKKIGVPIGECLASLTDEDIKSRLDGIKNFLESQNFQENWLAESVYAKVYETIHSYIEQHQEN